MAEVCQEFSSKGEMCNRSSSQTSRDVENHIQLLFHTIVMRHYRRSPKRGTDGGNHFWVVAPEMQMGYYCHTLSGDYVIHGREAMVLCVETVQEAQQTRRARADTVANEHSSALLE